MSAAGRAAAAAVAVAPNILGNPGEELRNSSRSRARCGSADDLHSPDNSIYGNPLLVTTAKEVFCLATEDRHLHAFQTPASLRSTNAGRGIPGMCNKPPEALLGMLTDHVPSASRSNGTGAGESSDRTTVWWCGCRCANYGGREHRASMLSSVFISNQSPPSK